MGRVIEVNVGQGKPILKSFMDSGFPVDFSDTVPEGRRAMTVQVDEVNAVAGFIRPGNRVDLFVNIAYNLSGFSSGFITADLIGSLPSDLRDSIPPALLDAVLSAPPDDTSAQTLTGSAIPKDVILPVLQNVRVLATGRDPYREQLDKLRYPQQRTERNFNNVTVDVTPREAALLAAAIDVGDLLAILRNRDDESSAAFTTVSARDLFNNASEMARAEEERKTRVATAAGVDVDGNLVDADGNKLMSREQLAQAGLSVNANGELVDADGNVVDPDDVIVTADGRVLRKSELAAAGLAVNENGQIIDANGNVVSAEDVVVTASGEVMTKQELAAAGLSVNENGEIVDANGRVVDAAKLVKTADGKILTAEALAAAGLTVNENGEIVDENGNVVDPETLIVSADGKVLSKAQLAAAGLSVNENGEIVDADGNVIDPNELVVGANGEVITAKALAAAGLSINENGQIVDENGNVVDPSALAGGIARLIDLYIGGGSSDGVAKKAVLRTSD